MTTLLENNIYHNAATGALVLWSFSKSYYLQTSKSAGPQLHELMLALPIALHPESVSALYSRVRDGAIPKAVTERRRIVAGLQSRLIGFAPRTLRSLNLALSANLLECDRLGGMRFPPAVMSRPVKVRSEEIRRMLAAADRMGHWIALSGFDTACSMLGVRF